MENTTNFIKFENNDIFTAAGTGSASTLTFDEDFTVEPVASKSDNAPTHRLLGKSPKGYPIQIGAIWKNKSKAGEDYLTLHIRDHNFRANLGQMAGQDEPALQAIIPWDKRD